MATGDQTDFLSRLKAVLPTGWFPDVTPVLDAVLTGPASMWAWIWSLISYTILQTRLLTATDIFLDVLCHDFLGTRISRRSGESDTLFRIRIQREILRPRGTRAAIVEAIEDLTGNTPIIIEPGNSGDNAAYDTPNSGYDMARTSAMPNIYGSRLVPFQVFIVVARPVPGTVQYGTSDADIYAGIAAVMPAATTAWTRLVDPTGLLDVNFILNISALA